MEIDSADRFQGRDKEVIVLSMVRSNVEKVVGGLLEDWRRVNVGFTRGRSKFVVFGSKGTLGGNEVLGRFLGVVEREGWGVDLDERGVEGHCGVSSSGEGSLGMEGMGTGKRSAEERDSSVMKKKKKKRIALQSSVEVENGGSPVKGSSSQVSPKDGMKGLKKKCPKIIKRTASQVLAGGGAMGSKMRKLKEQVAVEIFEDLTGEEHFNA